MIDLFAEEGTVHRRPSGPWLEPHPTVGCQPCAVLWHGPGPCWFCGSRVVVPDSVLWASLADG